MDYCGKNGCLELGQTEGSGSQYCNIYLNSPIVYIYQGEQSLRVIGGERPEPDISFELVADDEGDLLTGQMAVDTLFAEGVSEFIIALMDNKEKIGTKEGLIAVAQQLLDKNGASWGIVHPDPQELQQEKYLS